MSGFCVLEKSLPENRRIEGLKVAELFADADELDRNFQLVLYRQDDASARRSVKLCEDNACQLGDIHELLRLVDRVLPRRCVEHEKDLAVGIRELFVNDGEEAASFTVYTPQSAREITFAAEGTANMDLEFYELEVPGNGKAL